MEGIRSEGSALPLALEAAPLRVDTLEGRECRDGVRDLVRVLVLAVDMRLGVVRGVVPLVSVARDEGVFLETRFSVKVDVVEPTETREARSGVSFESGRPSLP